VISFAEKFGITDDLDREQLIEDFYIAVRTQAEREVGLRFEQANTGPLSDQLQELKSETEQEGA